MMKLSNAIILLLTGGLEGGTIAGIVVPLVFLVGGLGVAFYLYKRGGVKLPLLLNFRKNRTSERNGYVDPVFFNGVSITA